GGTARQKGRAGKQEGEKESERLRGQQHKQLCFNGAIKDYGFTLGEGGKSRFEIQTKSAEGRETVRNSTMSEATGESTDTDSPFGSLPTFPPFPSFKSKVSPVGIGVIVGLCVILLLIIICVLRRKCKCCKRKKPTLKEKMMKKMGLQKKQQPFSISAILDKK
ncbi:hypothetical protein COCON_G00186800, partial [Conger conger]